MNLARGLAALLLTAPLLPALAAATPLPDPDQNPLVVNLGLPRADESAWLLPASHWAVNATVATASHAAQDAAGAESVLFDGETTRATLRAEVGVGDRFQLGVELPYVLHETGNLDRVVARWHSWFGLPDGPRRLVPEDQLAFTYTNADSTQLDVNRNKHGTGDVRLLAGWQLTRDAQRATALRLSVKLPTGDSDRLTGSGGSDVALTLAGDYRALGASERWSAFYRLSLVAIGTVDVPGPRARDAIYMAAGGVGFAVGRRLELGVQARVRSRAFESALTPLGSTAVLLNTGGTVHLTESLQFQFTVGEDVAVDTAPDVTFTAAIHYTPSASR